MSKMCAMFKLSGLMGLVLLIATGSVLAGAGQMSSGRPSAVLTPEQCQQVWSQAVPSGDSLAQANAAPFIANFAQADGDQDGSVSKTGFDAACGKGLVKFTDR